MISGLFFACSAKASSSISVSEETIEVPVTATVSAPIAPPDSTESEEASNSNICEPKWGIDSVETVKHLSLYREYYNQWKNTEFKNEELVLSAWPSLKYLLNNAPCVSQNMYTHGMLIVKNYFMEKNSDSLVKDKYVDTLMFIYDLRIKHFPSNPKASVGYLKGRQAMDLRKYRVSESSQYYPLYKQSFELEMDKTEPNVLLGYFLASIKYYQQKNIKIEDVFDDYLKIMDVINFNIDNKTSLAERDKSVSDNIEKIIVKLATCEKLVATFEEKFKANQNDVNLAKNIVKLFELRRCTDSDLYYKTLEKVHAISPNGASAFSMGKMAVDRKEYEKAKNYLIEATNLCSDTNSVKKASAYLLLAETYKNLGQSTNSRAAALKCLEYKPDEAIAYIIIGDLYRSSSNCQEKGMVVSYWAAYDKYLKAFNSTEDEKIKDIAQKSMNAVRASFPTTQDLFMRSITEGSSFTVGCWIGEVTTVRAR